MHRRMTPGHALARFLVYAIPLLAALVSIAPFLFMLGISFQSVHFISGNPLRWIPQNPTIASYERVLHTRNFVRWIMNSLLVAGSVRAPGVAALACRSEFHADSLHIRRLTQAMYSLRMRSRKPRTG